MQPTTYPSIQNVTKLAPLTVVSQASVIRKKYKQDFSPPSCVVGDLSSFLLTEERPNTEGTVDSAFLV